MNQIGLAIIYQLIILLFEIFDDVLSLTSVKEHPLSTSWRLREVDIELYNHKFLNGFFDHFPLREAYQSHLNSRGGEVEALDKCKIISFEFLQLLLNIEVVGTDAFELELLFLILSRCNNPNGRLLTGKMSRERSIWIWNSYRISDIRRFYLIISRGFAVRCGMLKRTILPIAC